MKKKIVLEYTLNSSAKVIFPRLSTAGGLSEWFADNVNINGSFLSFFWEKTEQRAEVVQRKENKYVRFKWIDADHNGLNSALTRMKLRVILPLS
jgi:uncharacterized protein YndB with AHSA1/START domain